MILKGTETSIRGKFAIPINPKVPRCVSGSGDSLLKIQRLHVGRTANDRFDEVLCSGLPQKPTFCVELRRKAVDSRSTKNSFQRQL